MSSFTSDCLQTLENTTMSNSTKIWNTLSCPYSSALTFSTLPSINGLDVLYLIVSLIFLIGIQIRTKSFAFTGLVILICGGALMTVFPLAWIKIGLAMVMLAFAGVGLKIFQDRQ